jgi:imidazolonepropionase-like amidohydrolase
LHWELARFVEAGLSPLQVLRLATEGAAATVGADDLGTIAPNKTADLVLLRANPLDDIRNTESVWRVIKGGWVFDPEKLERTASDPSTASANESRTVH